MTLNETPHTGSSDPQIINLVWGGEWPVEHILRHSGFVLVARSICVPQLLTAEPTGFNRSTEETANPP